MDSRTRNNPVDREDEWQHLRLLLLLYDLTVAEHPSDLTQELFDEALLLVRLKCGEDLSAGEDAGPAH